MSELVRVEILPRPGRVDGHLVRINGVEIPVVTYGIEPPEQGGSGRALVSLLIPADSVQVGGPSTGEDPQVRPAAPTLSGRSAWGTPVPDPREGIPGWAPQVAEVPA